MTTVDEELRRILAPPGGRSLNSTGVRVNTTGTGPLFQLSMAFHNNPDLVFEALSLGSAELESALSDTVNAVGQILEYITTLSAASPAPADPALLDTLRVLAEMLESTNPKELASSPAYQQWLSKSEEVLKGALAPQLRSDSVVVPPGEARRLGLQTMRLLTEALADLENRAELLATAFTSFEQAPVNAALKEHVLKEVRRGIAIQQEKLKSVGTLSGDEASVLLASRAALRQVSSSTLPEKVLSLEGTILAEPDSELYPANPPEVTASAGPYFIPDPVYVTVSHEGETEVLQFGPTGYPTLFATTNEEYTWGSSAVEGSAGPFTLASTSRLQLFFETDGGVRLDLSVEIAAGSYSVAEMSTALNDAWAALGVTEWVEASESAGVLVTPTSGSMAFGTGPLNTTLGLDGTGGILIPGVGPGTLLSSAEPFDLSSNPTLMFIATRSGLSVVVEVDLSGLGGSASAAQVRDAINPRLVTLGVDAGFEAFVSSGKLDLKAATTSDILTLLPCGALSPLGLEEGTVIQGTPEARTLVLNASYVASTAVDEGTYSAESLADLLQDGLGSDFRVLAVGVPGSRSITVAYVASDWQTTSLSSSSTGMGAYLGMSTYATTATDTGAGALAASLQRQSRLTFSTPVQVDPLEGVAEAVLSRATFRFFQHQGVADLTTEGANQLTLTRSSAWESSVGDYLVLLSGSDSDSVWEITEVDGVTLRAAGDITPAATGSVRWGAGPNLGDRTGHQLRVLEGPLTGTYRVASTRTPLEVELETGPTQAGQGSAELGEVSLRITGVGTSDLLLTGDDKLSFLPNTIISPDLYLLKKSTTSWLRISSPLDVAVGDYLEWRSYGTVLESYRVLEVAEAGAVIRVDLSVTPTFDKTYSTQDIYNSSYRIVSTRYARMLQGQEELRSWRDGSSARTALLTSAKSSVLQALQRRSPTPGMVARASQDLAALVEAYQASLTGTSTLRGTPVGDRMDHLLDMLDESGSATHERALRRCDLSQLFSPELTASPASDALAQLRELMLQVARSMEEEGESEQLDYLDGEEEFELPDDRNRAEVFDGSG